MQKLDKLHRIKFHDEIDGLRKMYDQIVYLRNLKALNIDIATRGTTLAPF